MIDFRSTLDTYETSGSSPTPRRSLVSAPRPNAGIPNRPPAPGKIRISFEVYEEFAPAFRSAVDELSSILGTRVAGAHRFAKEQALTDAIVGVGQLRAATFAAIPAGDPDYV